jgi:arabinose-5-phosphate isomerase
MTHHSMQEIIELARGVIDLESRVVSSLDQQLGSSLYHAAKMMMACQGHILTSGAGTSNSVASRFAHLLSCCGTPALFIHPGDSQHGLSGAVTERDVLFCISKGGETIEVCHLAQIAKARGANLISILESSDSTLGKLSDVNICVQAPPESDPYGMIATGSSLFNSALCDALCVILLEMRGYTKQKFGETHPGGAVGLKLASEENV